MKHLLAISLGPVQDFIAAARRTSDLSAGSVLLVDVARVVATCVQKHGGGLIFPASVTTDAPNKILAELPEAVDPRDVAAEAKAAANTELARQWQEVKQQVRGGYDLNETLADAQIARFLEFNAAWVPYPTDAEYPGARKRVEALLAGRKNLRDFVPPPEGTAPPPRRGDPGGIYAKSPLDPAWECVLNRMPEVVKDKDGKDKDDEGVLKLRRTEYLDAVSILKRSLGGSKAQKVPSTRDFARRDSEPGFYSKDRWKDEDAPEPFGYFAILIADGDAIGRLLGGRHTPDAHRQFSTSLAHFAEDAKRIVARHDGHAVYAGGDDVMAFLPAKEAVPCARDLSKSFRIHIPGATLSAGVAIVHYLQPLSQSREAAADAEKMAKDSGRDALCLALHTRGGQPLLIPRKWDAWTHFDELVAGFSGDRLTRGVAYELRELAREFEGVAVPAGLLALEAARIWDRKQPKSDKIAFDPGDARDVDTLRQFADLMIAARFLTAKGEK